MNRYLIYTTDGDYEAVDSELKFEGFLVALNDKPIVTNTGGRQVAFVPTSITKVVDVTDNP